MKQKTLIFLTLLLFWGMPISAQENAKPREGVKKPSSSVEDLWKVWYHEASTKGATYNDAAEIFRLPSFAAFTRTGIKSVEFVINKLKKDELGNLFVGEFIKGDLLTYTSKTVFHLKLIATPENSDLTVFHCEEFPDMEIGRRAGQVRKLWLKWWTEKDKKIPVWFRGRYQMWQTAKQKEDKVKTEAAYRKTIDLGIFALPFWMEKLQSDPKESTAIISAISELSSGEVAPEATPQQVQQWWKKNKIKWTKVTS